MSTTDVEIEVVDYDPRWPSMFQSEKKRLAHALRDFSPEIEHVGSTSLPGLAAKPTIDISIGVTNEALLDCGGEPAWKGRTDAKSMEPQGSTEHRAFVNAILALGYRYIGNAFGRLVFFYIHEGRRTFILHGTIIGTVSWSNLIYFRDYLRAHPDVMTEYAELKRELATKKYAHAVDYNAEKFPFIAKVISKAHEWRAAQNNGP